MNISYVNLVTVLLVTLQLTGAISVSWWFVLWPTILYLLVIFFALLSAVVVSRLIEDY